MREHVAHGLRRLGRHEAPRLGLQATRERQRGVAVKVELERPKVGSRQHAGPCPLGPLPQTVRRIRVQPVRLDAVGEQHRQMGLKAVRADRRRQGFLRHEVDHVPPADLADRSIAPRRESRLARSTVSRRATS